VLVLIECTDIYVMSSIAINDCRSEQL